MTTPSQNAGHTVGSNKNGQTAIDPVLSTTVTMTPETRAASFGDEE